MITGMTLEKFIETYALQGKVFVDEINYLQDILPCPVCHGWGKMDWVDVARGSTRLVAEAHQSAFEVDKLVYHWKIENTDWEGTRIPCKTEYITTTPVLDAGDILCENCFGSGMYLRAKSGDGVYLNSLGRWYKKNGVMYAK